MDLHLALDGDGPLARQLVRALRQAILQGRLSAGGRLPPSRSLAAALGLSRNTVLAAYEQLRAEGFIDGRAGSGSFVSAACPSPPAPAPVPERAPRLSAYGRRVAAAAAQIRPRSAPALRYDLGYGTPAVTPSMQSAWRRALVRAADDTSFGYPPATGLPQLRSALAAYLRRRRGIVVDPQAILIIGGTQQGIDLCARMLLDPGDTALVEEPCYQGLVHGLAAYGAHLQHLPVDQDGLCVDALAAQPARLLAITPSHQFPTGAALTLSRRLAVLEWAERSDAYVLEDDYDGEYRHGGAPLAALKALDRAQRVIYLGSFSRVLFPAARLGYLVLPTALQPSFGAARWLADRGSPAIEQRALAELIDSGRFERLLLASARQLAERRAALLAAIASCLGAGVSVVGAQAGMHVCLWLPLSAGLEGALVATAGELGVAVSGINRYCQRPPERLGLLIGYAHLAPAQLRTAIERLRIALQSLGWSG